MVGEVADGDGFVAVGGIGRQGRCGGPVAVVAPLLAQLAGAALGAFVDGVLPLEGSWWPGGAWWGGCWVVVAGAPGGPDGGRVCSIAGVGSG